LAARFPRLVRIYNSLASPVECCNNCIVTQGHEVPSGDTLSKQSHVGRRSLTMTDDFVATLDSQFTTTATPVVGADFRRVNQQLLECFFPNVKLATGKWVYNNFRWHAYTFNHETAISGVAAFDQYRQQPMLPFYIYNEFDDDLFDCAAPTWPDVRAFNNDIYVFPHTMAWLFTATHEMSIGLGPFFASPSG